GFFRALRAADRAVFDRAGAAFAGDAAAGDLFNPVGTPADGAAGLRSAVSLVCRAWRGRAGLGCLDLLEEPGPSARWRYRGEVPDDRLVAAAGQAAAVAGAFQRRWHPDRSLGQHQELPGQGCTRPRR